MSEERIVVIGASAGGVDALISLVRTLPADFPAPVCVVLHVPPDAPSLLPHILAREGRLQTKHAEHGEKPRPGVVYVAPPDRHLVIGTDGTLRVTRGPRENRHRPAVDPLFRSAAVRYRERAIGLILTGTLDDGTGGLHAIKEHGGIAIVQDPGDAMYPGMPQNAIEHVAVDHVAPLADLGPLLTRTAAEDPPQRRNVAAPVLETESRMAELDPAALESDDRPGTPSPYSCPDCGGVLWEIEERDIVRYRCRVGHAYSPETMLSAQDEVLEEALWSAVKTLEESARLSKRLAAAERARGHDWLATRFEEKEHATRERVEVIRRHLLRSVDSTVPVEVPRARSH